MKQEKTMPGIIFDRVDAPHPRVDSDNANYYLEFDKTEDYFEYFDNEIAFIKNVERLVRKHQFIRVTYPRYLKEIIGLKECQVMPGIKADDKGKVSLEMHHGPILTLFDTCEIVTNAYRARGAKDVNTFVIANEVVEQHRLNHVRVMFLCKSAHQKVHDEGIFLNYRHGFGDTLKFLEIFKDGVDKNMKIKINEYLAWSMEHDSTDNNVFRIADTMREWGNNDFDEFDSVALE
jgi:hypothetical protein